MGLEEPQRLTHLGATDSQRFAQLAVRREGFVGQQFAVLDHERDLFGSLC